MNIAEKKRKGNIAEYIIFMYQTEDLIRVYNFDLEQLEEYVIRHFPVDAAEKESLQGWYAEIVASMKAEGIIERGHLLAVQEIVEKLSILSDNLLDLDEEYQKIYNQAKPFIEESLSHAAGKITDPIQICFNGIYGLLLLRMNGKEVDPSLMEGIDAFGNVLSYLSFAFKKDRMSE